MSILDPGRQASDSLLLEIGRPRDRKKPRMSLPVMTNIRRGLQSTLGILYYGECRDGSMYQDVKPELLPNEENACEHQTRPDRSDLG
jgi:hypothetical protein